MKDLSNFSISQLEELKILNSKLSVYELTETFADLFMNSKEDIADMIKEEPEKTKIEVGVDKLLGTAKQIETATVANSLGMDFNTLSFAVDSTTLKVKSFASNTLGSVGNKIGEFFQKRLNKSAEKHKDDIMRWQEITGCKPGYTKDANGKISAITYDDIYDAIKTNKSNKINIETHQQPTSTSVPTLSKPSSNTNLSFNDNEFDLYDTTSNDKQSLNDIMATQLEENSKNSFSSQILSNEQEPEL